MIRSHDASLAPAVAVVPAAPPVADGAALQGPLALAMVAVALVAVALGGLAAALAYALGRQRARDALASAGRSPAPQAAPSLASKAPTTLPPELGGAALVPAQASLAAPAASASALVAQPGATRAPEPTSALLRLLEALAGPALLIELAEGGARVAAVNPELRRHWPGLRAGTWVHDSDAWPPALLRLVAGTAGRAAADDDDWRSLALPGTPAALLAWQPAGGASAAGIEGFSFTLSHDLRAPLRVVEGFTKIVKEDYGAQLDRVGNEHLDRVLGATARMNLMIDALLNLARLSQQPLSRQRVNLSQLAAFVVDDLRRAWPDREVEVDIEPGLATQGDPMLLRLVLENLLGNAWKYTGKTPAGKIALRREGGAGAGGVAEQLLQGFVVSDNGAGFDMRSADRLFGLFQRLHSASDFPGHGVGLASVRRIVQRHGGEIWAESEPGRGASFHFTLGP